MDLYSYVGNDPLNKTDPSGLKGDACYAMSTGIGQVCAGAGLLNQKKESNSSFVGPIPVATTTAAATATAAETTSVLAADAAATSSFGLAPLAVVIGALYSPKLGDGTVGNRQMMFHYSPMQALSGQLRPGSYLTTHFGYSSKEAVSKLALDGSKANVQLYIHSFMVSAGQYRAAPYSILGTNTAAPLNNQSGGGTEFISTVPLDPIGPSVAAPGPY